jgi:regulator of sigma E protease
MAEFWIKAGQLLLSLSILVTLHELGHFIPARLFGTRVKKFYLFFDFLFPLPNVLNFSLWKIKRGETEYGIGWFPMGGYVQIDGMVDESMDTEALKEEPKPWEFRSKPAWQRLIIMVGGVVVNLILGFLIYSMVLFAWGDERLPIKNMKYGVMVDSTMMEYGFQNGDKLIQVGDGEIKYFSEIGMEVLINGQNKFTIERDGQEQEIVLPEDANLALVDKGVKQMFSPLFPFAVLEVMKGSNASEAGMLADDVIISVAGEPTPDAYTGIDKIKSHANETIDIVVLRGEEEVTLTADVTDAGTIGFRLKGMFDLIETETYEYGFFESIPAGFVKTGEKLGNYISSMSLLFTKEGASQIGGFGAIGGMFSPTWDWHSFWSLTAFLSLILAFMNILPIPALDGGHVMFLLYEIISGRKPGDKFMEATQTVGMVILLALLVFANGNDLVKLFMD